MASVRKPGALAVFSVAIMAAACSGSPVAPGVAQPPSVSSPSPQPPALTNGLVSIEDFFVVVKRSAIDTRGVPVDDGYFSLEVRFALRGTDSSTGATVEKFFLGDGLSGGSWHDGRCLERVRVPPGGVYDTLSTDQGYESWGYCAPYWGVVSAPLKEIPIFLTVYYVDDNGRAGSVSAKAIWNH